MSAALAAGWLRRILSGARTTTTSLSSVSRIPLKAFSDVARYRFFETDMITDSERIASR